MIPPRTPLCRRCDDAGYVGARETLDACPDCTERAEVMWQARRGLLPISNDRQPRPLDPAKMRRA